MEKKTDTRQKNEDKMLDNIGGRDEPAPQPAGAATTISIGWMGYVGGALWMTVFAGAGLLVWLLFTRG